MSEEVFYNQNKCTGLIKVLSNLKKNKVVCIDGEWGTGKSYFCEKLIEQSSDKLKCLKFNAFEHDHKENPLILLLAEFSRVVSEGETEKERYIKAVAELSVPLLGKGLDFALSLAHLKEVPGVKDASDNLKLYLEERINNYLHAEESIKGIKDELRRIVSRSDSKRIVVIIDELDRCRPSFALEIIEKIKHVFNVEGVHFILSMNKSQVLESISHTYGITSNSQSYLEKFIDFTVYLTPELTAEGGDKVPQADYAYYLAERSFKEINESNLGKYVADFCAFLAIRHGMGFREIDRFVDKCLTAYISYGNESSSCAVELLAFSVVGNTFLSIYSPRCLKTNIDGPFSLVNNVSRLICDLLIRGASGASSKQISSLKEPADREEVYNAKVFYGFSLYLYNKNTRNNHGGVLSVFSNYISNNFEPEKIVSSFNYWQSHLRNMS